MRLLLLLSLTAGLQAQVSAVLKSTMRYNDKPSDLVHALAVGDTWRCSMKISSLYYCSWNDGTGPGTIASRSVGFSTLSLDLASVTNTSFTRVQNAGVDSTIDFGITGSGSINGWGSAQVFKSGGFYYNVSQGLLYWQQSNNCWDPTQCNTYTPHLGVFSPTFSWITVSDDLGLHWCNPVTWVANTNTCPHNATTAKGDPLAFADRATANVWQDTLASTINNMANLEFVQFQSTDTTDQNQTYAYAFATQANTLQYYLARVPVATVNIQAGYQYYIGPVAGDVNLAANWCTTSYAVCAPSMTGLGNGYDINVNNANNTSGTMAHLPAPWNCYLTVMTWADNAADGGQYHQRLGWAPSMTGPFTPLTMDAHDIANWSFPQILLDTLVITDAVQKTGEISVIMGGSFNNFFGFEDYSPYFATYTLGPGANVFGVQKKGYGLQTQGISGIRTSFGNVANTLPARGLVALWTFDDFFPLNSPSTWTPKDLSDLLSGTHCLVSGALGTTFVTTGIRFQGSGDNSSTGSHCGASSMPSAFTGGDLVYSIITVYQPSVTTEGAVWYFGGGLNSGDGEWLAQGRVNGGDWCLLSWSFNVMGCTTTGSQFSADNWYMVSVLRSAGAPSASTLKIYRGLTPLTLGSFGSAPSVTATGNWYFGAKSNISNTAYQKPLNGYVTFQAVYNRVVTLAELKRIYDTLKTALARAPRSVTVQ